jgi:LacI family transcriptional regulator, galactose operon repressor
MATLKDVAKKVGVSVATVSYVLTGRGSVSKAVSEKVQAAVKELGYRPNRKAQAMRTGQSKSIGMILPDLTKPYFPHLAQQVESAARKAGYAVLLVDCQNQAETEVEGFELLAQQSVDGIIWFPLDQTTPTIINSLRCPIVLIDRKIPGYDTVHCDFSRGGALQAEYAIKLGHKRVGLLSGPNTIESAPMRKNGFVNAAGNDLDIVWDIEVPFSTSLNDEARAALKKNDVSLIACADDLVAIGAMGALNEYGIKVPDDVSILGFDNIPWSTIVTPKLTTINQPISAIGAEAVSILTQKIQTPDETVRAIILGVELVERDSAISFGGGK